jgi:hypothetical protein
MCTIEGCDGDAVSQGLCAKHYMRLRRTGDPNVTLKPGAKAGDGSKRTSSLFPEWSPRTRARFQQAMSLLQGQPLKIKRETVQRAIRSNGSVNVSKLVDMATMIYVSSLSHPR